MSIFKELWTNSLPSYSGKYNSFKNIKFEPKPVQKPHPPLWIGGESSAAKRRAVKLGDGWFPIGANPNFPLNTTSKYANTPHINRISPSIDHTLNGLREIFHSKNIHEIN